MNLEEMTANYQAACAKAVKEAIHQVVSQHDVTDLVEQGFNVATYLYVRYILSLPMRKASHRE